MALYKLLLEGRVSYRLARIYLVWSMVLAAVIPVLELPLYPAETIYYQIPIMESYEADTFDFVEDVAYADNTERLSEKSASIDWARFFVTLFWIIYAVVVMMNLAFVAWRLWQIKRLRDGAELAVYENYVLAVSDQVKSPFAFWRTIFLNRLYDGRKREQVILHELSHIRHNHTVERMMLEFMRCIFWFNPFVWYAGSSLEQVQEWQADGDVIREGYDVTEYRLLIFQQIFGCSIDITSGLYNKVTKKRFLMMTNFKRGRFSFIRVCAVIPILIGMVFAFGSVRAESEINVVESEQADNVAQTAANGKETTIEKPNEVHHPNLSAPTVSDSGKVTEKPAIGGIIEQNTGKSVSDQDATLHIAADGKISLNGKTVALADLESALRENKPAMVVISADKGVNMGQLADVRQILRNANVLRVKYINGNNNQSSPIVLPPAPQNVPNGIKLLDEITDARIPARNICRVLVNKNGKILRILTDMDNGYEVKRSAEIPIDNLDMLTGLVTEFLEKRRADTSTEKATLSTGKSVEVPMYEGIISLEYDVQAPYDVCVAVREAIAKVFYDIRNQLVSGWFGPNKNIDNLSEADRSVVVRAVPLKIREAEPRGEEYTPSPKIQVSRGKLYVNDKEMTLDEMRRQYPEYERVGRFNLSSIDNWKSALILTSPDTPKIYVRKSGIGINEDEGNLTIQQLSKAGLDAEVAVYLCDKESVANESIDAIVEALVANKRVKTFCFHVMVTDERVGVCNYLVEKQADGSVRKVGFKPNDVVASQTSKRISVSISSCLTDISSFEEIEDGKIVIVKVEDGKIYENDVLTTLEALEKKYPKSMQLTREEGGLEYRKLFKSELIATSSNINQIYMNGNKLTYKRTSSGEKASNYNIVCSLQQIATESLSSEVSVYVESATAQEIEAVIKSLEANKSVKCFCIVPRSTSKAILVEKQADGSIKRFAPSPKESKADNPATSDKESDYRIL
ncbi:MAG: biopolymer transporter ExbD [Alistipes sp.]|nr:biopolymer transporter ExbD [Alistipes sp.]